MKSLFFEDLTVGDRFCSGVSPAFTPAMIEAYFALTGDCFNIHRDDAFARRFGLPDAMVPGNLVVAVATGLIYQLGYLADSLVVQTQKRILFRKPVFIGDRISVVDTVCDVETLARKAYGRIAIERHVCRESGDVVQLIDQDYRVARRGSGS